MFAPFDNYIDESHPKVRPGPVRRRIRENNRSKGVEEGGLPSDLKEQAHEGGHDDWDIIGERNVAELYMESQSKGEQGILAVADMTRRETLDGIGGWTSSVRHMTGNVPVYVLANKVDLENALKVERMEVSQYSRSMGCPFMFTSAKTRGNVERARLLKRTCEKSH